MFYTQNFEFKVSNLTETISSEENFFFSKHFENKLLADELIIYFKFIFFFNFPA